MELIKPDIGLIFWMTISFSIILLLLKKYAWKPIMKALRDRESSIAEALESADKAREEVANLKSDNENLLKEARIERDKMLKEARTAGTQMIAEAKDKAGKEGKIMLENARLAIENEKQAAITELKNQVAALSVEMAEKLLRRELKDKSAQDELLGKFVGEITLN